MEEYLNMPIKEVITKFPQAGDILSEYNIGCVPCSVGSCLLKDIVKIHNLSAEDEGELMARIAAIVYPGRKITRVKVSRYQSIKEKAAKELKYSPPIKRLVDEHTLIKKWLALIPDVVAKLDTQPALAREIIIKGVDFIRSYADKFHHAKEEEILFKYFDENLDIIKAMFADHDIARGHVRAVVEALEKKDKVALVEHLLAYRDLLAEHIKKEDEILYPWMDRNLSTRQVGELFAKFEEADGKFDKEVVEGCRRFIEGA